jgi:MerR family transcriptional regulator, light-induced transcriptional regulator
VDLFSISQLSRYSGIKPHTIRIWEQRYNALKPNRSEGNTRYYSNTQLRRLLNIVSLMSAEHKASELSRMPDKKLYDLINEVIQKSIDRFERTEYFISQLLSAGMSYDEVHFEKIFSGCLVRYGLKDTYTKVVYPMLERIGLLWSCDSIPPANEHFMSNILKQKFFTAIDSLPPAKTSEDKWLLFLQEDEFHEIGLLIANYLIRLSGRQVIYLGGNVPFHSLVKAIKDTRPAYVLFFVVHRDLPENIDEYLNSLSNYFSGKKIFVSGDASMMNKVKPGKKTKWLKCVQELEQELTV